MYHRSRICQEANGWAKPNCQASYSLQSVSEDSSQISWAITSHIRLGSHCVMCFICDRVTMMDKQRMEPPPFTSPVGRSNGFKIPKKSPDDWCEEVQVNSPLTRLGSSEHRHITIRKRPFSSSYESFNIPRNKETHAYYTSTYSHRFLSTSASRVMQGSPENLYLPRKEQFSDRHKEAEKETEAKSEKRTSLERKEQAQGASLSTVCRDVSNTPISPQKDLNFGRRSSEEGGTRVSKALKLECKNSLTNNVVGPSSRREKTYCYKRAEYRDKKTPLSPTSACTHSYRDKPSSSSSESVTDSPRKSSDHSIRQRAAKNSRESKTPSPESCSGDPPMNSPHPSSSRLSRRKMQQTTRKGNLPHEPIVLSSDEEEREHEESVILGLEQTLGEGSVKMKDEKKNEKPSPSPSSDVEPMDCSPATLEPLLPSEDSVLQLKFLTIYFGQKRGRAKGPAKVTPKSIEIPLQVSLHPSKCILLNTMKLQKYGLWLTHGGTAVIILWIATDYVPQVEKQIGIISRNQASKSNELIFLELEKPLSINEQSLMSKIMKEASENGLRTLADILTIDEVFSMMETLSSEDFSFKANCGIAFKKQQQQESSNSYPPVDPREASKVTSSYTLIQRYKDGRYSVSVVARQDDNIKEVDKGGTLLRLLVYPPPPTKGGLAVTNEDLECLEHGEFLNDVIIDFYLKYLLLEHFPKSFAEKCHLFSSFFFKCLTRKDNVTNDNNSDMLASQRRHHRVKTWTRHVDIFTKDFVFVPVNENSHWYLVVICFPWMETAVYEDRREPSDIQDVDKRDSPSSGSVIIFNDRLSKKEETQEEGSSSDSQDSTSSGISRNPLNSKIKIKHDGKICKRPCLLIFDSLKTGSAKTTVQVLREYLKAEWEVRRKTPREFSRSSMRDLYPKVPKQNNSTDCGLYLLQYVESFAQKPIESFEPPMRLENWFPASVVKNKRDEIRDLILRLHVEQSKKS
ncbi:sentrin-specific protease 7 isoform X3 [Dendropsophus ebraccatus]|uniref:sentrin-specific protease 7 isoform X3 n=1 Tax=Dendropsophus ebraccatus TaxID=150705 RepID=UPI003831A276